MELNETTIKHFRLAEGAYIYFIGIGGSSMSGLAELSKGNGYCVAGSDRAKSAATEKLETLGIKVNIGHDARNITCDLGLVVYTIAISPDNPEYLRAEELGIPTIERGLFLSYIASEFAATLAVCGVHGKTTTTTMLAAVLGAAGLEPSVHVGGVIPGINSNVIVGGNSLFVTEACEYHDNFLKLSPTYGIMLNVEPEHLDYFGTIERMQQSFAKFAAKIPEYGLLAVCSDSPAALDCAKHAVCDIITFSLTQNNPPEAFVNTKGKRPLHHYSAADCSLENGAELLEGFSAEVLCDGEKAMNLRLHIPGLHNVSNALSVIAVARHLGADYNLIARGFDTFRGAKRRFEHVGDTAGGAHIISDYAHHPSEIKAVLAAAAGKAAGKIIAVFQPHTYSRAAAFRKLFPEALRDADLVIITDIYAAREKDPGTISAQLLKDDISAAGISCEYLKTFDEISAKVLELAKKDDLIMLLGAGTVNLIADMIVNR